MKKIILLVFALTTITINLLSQTTGTFVDERDGHEYKWVKLGEQVWMAENLAFKPSSGSFWAYDNNSENVALYGYLYDWKTAKKVCPKGWHLPSNEEWMELEKYLGLNQWEVYTQTMRGQGFGDKLKATNGWESNGNGTDDYGFTALPGGNFSNDDNKFYAIGSTGLWWSASKNKKEVNIRWIIYSMDGIGSQSSSILNGYSVRCIKD